MNGQISISPAEEMVLVPRQLLGAAAHSLETGSESPKTLAELRHYSLAKNPVENSQALQTNMPPHQLRVLEELAQLSERLQKLTAFFDTERYRSLDVDERGRLKEQSLFMGEYQRIMAERVAAF